MQTPDSRADGRPPAGPSSAWRHLPWLFSPLIYPLLSWSVPLLPEPLRATLAFLALVPLPGWLLHRLIVWHERVGLVADVARAFLLGVALISALGLAAWFSGGDTGLGAVPALDAEAPPFAGRLSSVVWGEALFLFAGALILMGRTWLERLRRTEAARVEGRDSAVHGQGDVPRTAVQSSPPAAQAAAPAPSRLAEGLERPRLDPWQRITHEAYRLGEEQQRERPLAPPWATVLVLGVIVVVASALAFYAGGNFGYTTDSPDHIACVREMVERDRILPRTTFYQDGDGASVDPRKGFFHVALAAVAQLSAVDATRLWMLLPGILAPFALIIFHSLARSVLRSEGAALFATFLAVICYGEVNRGMFARLAYGNFMGIVIAWGVVALALGYALGARGRVTLWLVGLGAFAGTATHAFAAVDLFFSLGAYLVAVLLVHGWRHRTLTRTAAALGAVFVGALPVLLWRLVFASGSLSPIHTHRQGALYLQGELFVMTPFDWMRYLGGLGLAGIVASFFLWKRARDDDGVLFLVTLSVAPLLVLLNPFVMPVLEPILGYLVSRFASLIPFLIVLAYVARRMGGNLLELHSVRRVLTALAFYALMVWLLFPHLEAFARSYASANLKAARGRSVLAWSDLMQQLDAQIAQPAVILSDPLTDYAVPALTRHYAVAVLHQHGSPSDSLAVPRLAACRDVLSPYLGTGEKARICKQFAVGYVLLNNSFNRSIQLFFCDVGPDLGRQQRRALESDPSLFARVADYGERGALYRVRQENLAALCGIVTPGQAVPAQRSTEMVAGRVLLRTLPTDAIPVLPDTVAGITLTAVSLDRDRVARGDSLGMTLYWRRVGAPRLFPTTTQLHLETEAPRGPLWSTRLSKVHRWWIERRHGVRYRLRQPAVPLDGAFGIEHWPRDRYIVDRQQVRVPARCAVGTYAVKIGWMEQSFLPNVPLRHYLSDRDAYEGETVATVEVY